MDRDELRDKIGDSLRSLRKADTQAAAVAWMTNAYRLMEQCLPHLEAPPEPARVVLPTRQPLVIVQTMPDALEPWRGVKAHRQPHYVKQQVDGKVYLFDAPPVPVPGVHRPPLPAPLPKAWTREDTRKLERTVKGRQYGRGHG